MAQRVTDPSSLYSKMTPKASSTSAGSNFVDLTLGRSSDAVTIKTLAAPPIDATIAAKSSSFDYLVDLLSRHQAKHSGDDLSLALQNHFDLNASSTWEESSEIADKLRRAVFSVDNLTGLGFFDPKTKRIDSVGDEVPPASIMLLSSPVTHPIQPRATPMHAGGHNGTDTLCQTTMS